MNDAPLAIAPTGPRTPQTKTLMLLAAGAVVLIASVLALVLSQRDPPTKTSSIGARLELAAGDVTLKDAGKEATVISGVPVPSGADLATGKSARALVRLSDGSAIFLRSDSRVTLGEAGVTLQAGEVWLDAPPSERGALVHRIGDVTVSAADAGVSLRLDGGEVTVVVTRGLAVVTSPQGRVEANAGEQAKVASGAPPKVSALAYWDDWTGGMGDHRPTSGVPSGAGRIYGVDALSPPGTPARTLEISRQSVRAVLRDGLAETEVDQTFSNPGGRQVEGWYWFTIPERAIVTSFAVETDGALIDGEVIEKQEAAAQYGRAVRTGHEPALLEWIDGRSYRARIFPVPASGSRRVVLRYMELLGAQGGKLAYLYPMRSDDAAEIGELSLSVDLGTAGVGAPIATLADAVIEEGGRRVTMRRSGYTPRADFQLEVSIPARQGSAMRVGRFSAGGDRADYIMARYSPDLDWQALKEMPAELAIVVDTSASGDEAARQQKSAAAEAILRSLSGKDRFALIALDQAAKVLHPKEGLAEATDKEIAAALERLAEHAAGGATDLGAIFDVALSRVHGAEQPAIVYIGDGMPTIGEVSGERLAERLRRSLSVSRARFFTVAVGVEANASLLAELAREGGGQLFRIAEVEAGTQEVLRLASAIKTPTVTDLGIDLGAGLDEVLITASGKVSRGEEVILLARTHHALPKQAKVKGRLGGKDFERDYPIELERGAGVSLVPRLWAAEKMRRLMGEAADPEDVRGKIVELGIEYGLMTPFTSILALESEVAYQQQGIRRRRSPLRGSRLTSLDPRSEEAVVGALFPPSAMGCAQKEAPAASEAAPSPMTVAAQSPHAAGPADMPREAPMATAAPPMPLERAQGQAPDDPMKREVDGLQQKARSGGGGPKGMTPCAPGDPLCSTLNGDPASAEPKPPPPVDEMPRKFAADAPAKPAPKAVPFTASAPASVTASAPASGLNKLRGPAKDKPLADARDRNQKAPRAAKKMVLGQCSDSARRPLAERVVLWSKRLRGDLSATDLIARYENAKTACELPDWRAEAALLQLLQAKVRTEGAAEALLRHFDGASDTQTFVAQAILRRTVDQAVAAAVRRVLFGERIRWAELDNQLAELDVLADRIDRLRKAMLEAPGDPEGDLRLVRLLAQAGQREEALAHGRRLRDQGLMSPALAISLGDVLAAQGFEDDAIRTYSEIVEFDPASAESRRLLGDIFLRHGWYAPAYRQFKSLTEVAPSDAAGWLRMAAAAAGSGRVDEALRIQRQVAAAEGTPGPDDPRAWARLWSAARLARLLAAGEGEKPSEPGLEGSLTRKLKELQVFAGPAALCVLTWEDLDASLAMAGLDGDTKEAPLADVTDASPVGLSAILLPAGDLDRLRWVARWKSDPPGRDVKLTFHTLAWDGKAFVVKVKSATIAQGSREIAL
ncbi:MAG TPA: VIT domain-containing protein [Polyangiaceae bacterium]|nr:VIT domain-containing protein [Polyangiaceae bacterium]